MDLRRAAGTPPQTTMRGHLRKLAQAGVIERGSGSSLDYELSATGTGLMPVLRLLERWLAHAPHGPLEPGTLGAKNAIKALVEGWSTAIIRALAARPLSLTELDRVIAQVSYPSLERRLLAMRLAGLIEARPGRSRGTPYAVTDWLRMAVAPIAAAARWERGNAVAEADPINRLDIEASFLLTVPILVLPTHMSGICRLAVDVQSGNEHRLAGVLADVREGRVVNCTSKLRGNADATVTGTAAAWLRAALEGRPDHLEVGGEPELALALVDGLNAALFAALERG